MWPYFLILIIDLLLFFFYKKTGSRIMLFLAIAVLGLFVGLRSNLVGTDSMGYARMFLSMDRYHSAKAAAIGISTEDGWNVLNWVLYKVHPRYWFLFTVVGIFNAFCAVFVINRESPAIVLSLFFYITLGFYLFGFAAVRQSVALSFYCLAIPHLLDRKFVKYTVLVLAGALFHQTILIALPLYFLFTMEYTDKRFLILIIGTIVAGAFLPQLFKYATELQGRYGIYAKIKGGGELFAVYYTVMAVFFWSQRQLIIESQRSRYDILLMMLSVSSIIYLFVVFGGIYGEMTRLALYFQLAIVFLWAELYRNRTLRINPISWAVIIAVHLVYFYFYLSRVGGIVPYVLNLSLK